MQIRLAMKDSIILLMAGFGLVFLIGCNSHKADYSKIDTSDILDELSCAYQKTGDTICVTRIAADRNKGYRLWNYAICALPGSLFRVL